MKAHLLFIIANSFAQAMYSCVMTRTRARGKIDMVRNVILGILQFLLISGCGGVLQRKEEITLTDATFNRLNNDDTLVMEANESYLQKGVVMYKGFTYYEKSSTIFVKKIYQFGTYSVDFNLYDNLSSKLLLQRSENWFKVKLSFFPTNLSFDSAILVNSLHSVELFLRMDEMSEKVVTKTIKGKQYSKILEGISRSKKQYFAFDLDSGLVAIQDTFGTMWTYKEIRKKR